MIDFLKAYPSFTIHDYIWGLSAPLIKIMLMDATQVYYLDEKQSREYKQWKRNGKGNGETDDPDVFANALGIPTFG
ncbi:MAG: hypothetical protein K2N48_00190 [Muribaculaceae bacterium]|nr:hypothetical protein [Muribaculaceae bacterium]